MTTYGYIRTSRQRIQGTAGSDPEAQAHQLHQEDVPEDNIHRDVGVSGGTGTNSRAGWRALNARLISVGPTRCGRPTSPTCPWPGDSSTWWQSWTGTAGT